MILGYYFFSNPIRISENEITVLNVENKAEFRKIISYFREAIDGNKVDINLSDDSFNLLNIQKEVAMITDVLSVNFESKKLISKINEEISELCKDHEEIVIDIMLRLNELAGKVYVESTLPVTFKEISDISQIVKLLDFSIDDEVMTPEEKILEYMKLNRDFLGKKLFIFVNLHTFFDKEEMESFSKNIIYEKFNVLLLESHLEYKVNSEKVVCIDRDLCEIY